MWRHFLGSPNIQKNREDGEVVGDVRGDENQQIHSTASVFQGVPGILIELRTDGELDVCGPNQLNHRFKEDTMAQIPVILREEMVQHKHRTTNNSCDDKVPFPMFDFL
ncbi:hypothetical protein WICPIJ_002737 [Wickerhamomyces pijperi]|uniref:Uncharacterized protein n=1 Tax=Wickerhamomyces pijperi TaxID=599730 RepID=A0A9P8Q8L1_WICPI|nr:hypothetical protein WICPIJ_002737 [Wickerhamomyces pijperi]